MEIKDLETVNAELQEKKGLADNADYKMVTFSLAEKDYGVDIMNVKEIAKADKFTYVPNAASFVRGVYNLRGDIIPIIDLRTFFHLPLPRKEADDGQENMLILRIEDRVYGTIVDRIDKVVSINSETIQPPHPIFGDINVKYIGGVVEKHGSLYIILDVVHIFSQKQEQKQSGRGKALEKQDDYIEAAAPAEEEAREEGPAVTADNFGFIKEGLTALKKFYPSPVNEEWLIKRLVEWSAAHANDNIQLKNTADAEAYLETFYSPCNGKFWNSDYAYAVKALLPDLSSNNIQVWNAGCGKGYESFSLACILKLRYPDGRIKIWANDNDIMAIANAPNMVFEMSDVPDYCQTFMSKGRSGYIFNTVIKDSIVFEYHDITNVNTLPDIDIVVCRDTLSFLPPDGQAKVFEEISEKLKTNGIVILGKNEAAVGSHFKAVGKDPVPAYIRVDKEAGKGTGR